MILKVRDVAYNVADKEPFLDWLALHESEVASGTAQYQGRTVTPNSKATRYFAIYSMGALIGASIYRSAYLLVGSNEERKARMGWTLDTLMFADVGSIGQQYQLSALVHNIRGGEPITVADLIEASHDKAKAEALSESIPIKANAYGAVLLALILLPFLILLIAYAVILIQVHR